jgi:hypothetical protein
VSIGPGSRREGRTCYRRFLDHWANGEIDRDNVAEAERKLRGAGVR